VENLSPCFSRFSSFHGKRKRQFFENHFLAGEKFGKIPKSGIGPSLGLSGVLLPRSCCSPARPIAYRHLKHPPLYCLLLHGGQDSIELSCQHDHGLCGLSWKLGSDARGEWLCARRQPRCKRQISQNYKRLVSHLSVQDQQRVARYRQKRDRLCEYPSAHTLRMPPHSCARFPRWKITALSACRQTGSRNR
jgi:hypothetical protein